MANQGLLSPFIAARFLPSDVSMALSVIIRLLSPHIIPVVVGSCLGLCDLSWVPPLFQEQMLKKGVRPPRRPQTASPFWLCTHTHTHTQRLLPSPWHLIRPPAQRLPDVSVLLASFDYILSTPLAGSSTGAARAGQRRRHASLRAGQRRAGLTRR